MGSTLSAQNNLEISREENDKLIVRLGDQVVLSPYVYLARSDGPTLPEGWVTIDTFEDVSSFVEAGLMAFRAIAYDPTKVEMIEVLDFLGEDVCPVINSTCQCEKENDGERLPNCLALEAGWQKFDTNIFTGAEYWYRPKRQ